MRRVPGDEVIGDRGELVDVGAGTGTAGPAPLLFGRLVGGWPLPRLLGTRGQAQIPQRVPAVVADDDRVGGQRTVRGSVIVQGGQRPAQPAQAREQAEDVPGIHRRNAVPVHGVLGRAGPVRADPGRADPRRADPGRGGEGLARAARRPGGGPGKDQGRPGAAGLALDYLREATACAQPTEQPVFGRQRG